MNIDTRTPFNIRHPPKDFEISRIAKVSQEVFYSLGEKLQNQKKQQGDKAVVSRNFGSWSDSFSQQYLEVKYCSILVFGLFSCEASVSYSGVNCLVGIIYLASSTSAYTLVIPSAEATEYKKASI